MSVSNKKLHHQARGSHRVKRENRPDYIHTRYPEHECYRQSKRDLQCDLIRAAEDGDAVRLKELIASGVDVNDGACEHRRNETDFDWVPLYAAAANGHDACVRVLLEAGADPLFKGQRGMTALFIATRNNHLEVMRRLIAACPALVETADNFTTTPLIEAASRGHTEAVRILLQAAANPHACTSSGHSAEEVARAYAHVDVYGLIRDYETLEDFQCASACRKLRFDDRGRCTGNRPLKVRPAVELACYNAPHHHHLVNHGDHVHMETHLDDHHDFGLHMHAPAHHEHMHAPAHHEHMHAPAHHEHMHAPAHHAHMHAPAHHAHMHAPAHHAHMHAPAHHTHMHAPAHHAHMPATHVHGSHIRGHRGAVVAY